MKKLKKPEFNVKNIVCDCAESIQNSDKRNRIINASDEIQIRSSEYDSLAENQLLSEIKEHDIVAGNITKSEMVELYDRKFVLHEKVRPKYYDKILVSTSGICPICCLGQVGNLDHYLPKSLYPTYAVTPYNLLPVCRDCNHDKRNQNFVNNYEATLHPYYDEVDSVIWLKAEMLIRDGGLVARYYIEDDINDDDKHELILTCAKYSVQEPEDMLFQFNKEMLEMFVNFY